MSLFGVILDDELAKRGITARQAAREMGISHTTLYAVKNGHRTVTIDTALSVAKWMGVPLSTIIEGAYPEEYQADKTTQALKVVLEASPELKRVFERAADALDAGTLTLGDFRDIAEYATYRIRTRIEEGQGQ